MYQVQSPFVSERLRYVLNFVIHEFLQDSYDLIHDPTQEHLKITHLLSSKEFQLCLPEHLRSNQIDPHLLDNAIASAKSILHDHVHPRYGDYLTAIFCMITGYQEYLTFQPDVHHRFGADQCGWRRVLGPDHPWADILALKLARYICDYFGASSPKLGTRFESSIDVDWPWSHTHLKFRYRLMKWLKWSFIERYDTYNEILVHHEDADLEPRFFFLMGGGHANDYTNRFHQNAYHQLIQEIQKHADVGVHMPYMSCQRPDLMERSLQTLKEVMGMDILHNRQHYLRVYLPQTMRQLIACGIEHDHSFGFADATGFRLGTARVIPWFDLQADQVTSLQLHPLIAMDVAMKNGLQLKPDQLKDHVIGLAQSVMDTGGVFSLLWHNNSLSSIAGWNVYRDTYLTLLKEISELIRHTS